MLTPLRASDRKVLHLLDHVRLEPRACWMTTFSPPLGRAENTNRPIVVGEPSSAFSRSTLTMTDMLRPPRLITLTSVVRGRVPDLPELSAAWRCQLAVARTCHRVFQEEFSWLLRVSISSSTCSGATSR